MTNSDCLFCKIIAGTIPAHKIYEDEDTFVFLDIAPVSRGHFLVVPKNHAADLQSGSEADALAIMHTVYTVTPKVLVALGAAGYNLGMNHGIDASQDIFHTHVHVMPRYAGEPRRFEKMHPSTAELQEVFDTIDRAQTAL